MTKKVKTFFHILNGSLLPQPQYYKKIRKARFSYSLKYFASLIFLLSLVLFSLMTVTGLKRSMGFSFSGLKSSLESYPNDLVIEVKNGSLSTNFLYPYFFWARDGDQRSLMAVVSENSTQDDIQQFETPLIFTAKSLVVSNKENGMISNVLPYGNLNMIVNKQSVDNLLAVLDRLAPLLAVLSLLFVLLIGPFFAIVGAFVYLAIVSLVCYSVFRIWSKKHTYGKTLQISLHAVTLPFITKYVLFGFGYNIDKTWPVFSLLVAVFILSALYETYLS